MQGWELSFLRDELDFLGMHEMQQKSRAEGRVLTLHVHGVCASWARRSLDGEALETLREISNALWQMLFIALHHEREHAEASHTIPGALPSSSEPAARTQTLMKFIVNVTAGNFACLATLGPTGCRNRFGLWVVQISRTTQEQADWRA